MTLESLTRESFAENLNTTFRLADGQGAAREIDLVEVSDASRSGAAERFSLVFRGALDFFLPQSIYRIEHERLGAFELFLVAIGREPDGFRYEAVFNRFAEGGARG
jgi:hypothetical protein